MTPNRLATYTSRPPPVPPRAPAPVVAVSPSAAGLNTSAVHTGRGLTAPAGSHAPPSNSARCAPMAAHAPRNYLQGVLESRDIQGYWWLPFMPDGKVPGTLHFSQADIGLELLGGFAHSLEETNDEESGDEESNADERPREVVLALDSFIKYQPRISGVAQNGRPVTLERCNGRSLQLGFPQFASSTYGPQFVLVGASYDGDEEALFDEIAIRLSDLDVWARTSGFDQR